MPSSAREPERELWIGVDVGGSSIKLGAITPAGRRVAESQVAITSDGTAREIFAAVGDQVRWLAREGDLLGIGVGLPGLMDREAGRVTHSPNLPWLEGADIRGTLARAGNVSEDRIFLENDANVAALGEQWLGAARGLRHVVLVTLGTGIGGGLILDGRLFWGEGLAGELGHVTIDPQGSICGCGRRGCLETLSSATAARERAIASGLPAEEPGNLELLSQRAREGAGPERDLLEAVGADLGHGLAAALSLLDVRTFVIGGGFSAALDVMESGIRRGLLEWAYGERVSAVDIRRATLGGSAGWIGAARLVAAASSSDAG